MGIYERFVLPRLVDFVCARKPQMRQRPAVVSAASGEVLEIGFGSGLNLPFYDPGKVARLRALEPSDEMRSMARRRLENVPFPVEELVASAEEIPLADHSVDTVLVTYTLCTIPDAGRALAEMRRVLRAGGRLLFCEHGAAPDGEVLRWQNRLNPIWKRLSGGCNLNRPIPQLLETHGFRLREMTGEYVPGWRPGSFTYCGSASPS